MIAEALTKLSRFVNITGIVWGPDEASNLAAIDWWGSRFFAPNYAPPDKPDLVLIVPGINAIHRLRHYIAVGLPVVVARQNGDLEALEPRRLPVAS